MNMSNKHGGRRIKIEISEYAYPHSDSAKQNGVGQIFPLYKTGKKDCPFVRPTNAIEDFVKYGFDNSLFDELTLFHAISKYRLDRINKNLSSKSNSFNTVEDKI